MYNIAIIEDDLKLRKDLSDYFATSDKIQCVMAVDTVEKFTILHRDFMEIKLILMDIMLYNQSSVRSIGMVKQREPEAEIIMHTMMDDYDTIFQAICNGATGYLLKGLSFEELEKTIVATIEDGGTPLSPPVARKMLQYFQANPRKEVDDEHSLNDKESTVVSMLKNGHTYEEIAKFLDITINGVRYYVKNLYRKLQVKSKGELIRKWK